MRMYFVNKYESWPGFLSVYIIVRSNGINVVYKLHYLCGAVITLRVRHCQYNNVSVINDIDGSLIIHPVVRSNAPVRLKVQFFKQ